MSTNFIISKDCVYLEVDNLNKTCVQIFEDQTGNKKTYVKLEIPIEEWKKIVRDWNRQKTSSVSYTKVSL